jgi:hypothetical protein
MAEKPEIKAPEPASTPTSGSSWWGNVVNYVKSLAPKSAPATPPSPPTQKGGKSSKKTRNNRKRGTLSKNQA